MRTPIETARAHDSRTARIADQSRRLSPGPAELLAEKRGNLPVWVRSPKSGVEYFSGFSRAKLYEGAAKGYFRSVSIREPGQVKGTRLFHLQSIFDYIERCEAAAAEQHGAEQPIRPSVG